MNGRYLEDFAVGQIFSSGRLRVTQEQIKAFAAEFDPPRRPRRRRFLKD
jgi:acyl dehydratase